MTLIVLLRGINVGGHRRFRPTRLARALEAFDVVNIGAAGTFVVRRPGPRAKFRDALAEQLGDGARYVLCEGRRLLELAALRTFEQPSRGDVVSFVSFLASVPRRPPALPLVLPESGEWLVRVTALTKRMAVGEYRRHMRTIRHLDQLDALFGTLVTTRSRRTVNAILEVLREDRGRAFRRD